jgi:amino acid adenylation domain-containing protein
VYDVVVNDEGARSILPRHKPMPAGWRAESFAGTREECLAHIAMMGDGTVASAGGRGPDDAYSRSARVEHRLDILLADAARTYADRIALTVGVADLTYRDLFGRARRLAADLVAAGAQPESFVAVAVDRSAVAVIGMLGVVLSGAAYIPFDTRAPRSRLREIGRQAAVGLVTGSIPAGFADALGLTAVPVPPAGADGPAPAPALSPATAAYAIFTSGSTGKPKGVVTPHRAVVNSTTARFAVFPNESMTYLMLAPLTFDAAVAGLYFTLAAGGRLIVPTEEQAHDSGLVADLVGRYDATHLDGVPSQYAAILEFHAPALTDLRCVVVAGEALSQGLVRRHAAALPGVSLFNEYGPTESTVWAACHLTDPADDGPYAPIGTPIGGVQVEIVDKDLQPVVPGATGEIAISGRQLARGYLGQPDLTAARFVPHPRRVGERLYLTGDLGRVDADGRLVYGGRIGSMVKVRGFRVELGEVEGWLRAQADVVDAVVLPEPFAGTNRLVAVTVRSTTGSSAELPPLRTRLAEHLPAFMVPSVWHEIERMPLTAHGKIDRAAAAALVNVALADGLPVPGPALNGSASNPPLDLGDSVPENALSAPPSRFATPTAARVTLTRIEWTGLMAAHNLADGHARQGTPPQAVALIDRLPAIFRCAEDQRQLDVQNDFECTFFTAAGQPSVLDRPRSPMHHYSSSLSIEVIGNHLRLEGMSVGLLHPTFDNIHDILARHGVPLVPVTEQIFQTPEDPACWADFDALFLVTPNNPTGLDPAPEILEQIALECRRRGVLLIVDFSFRFFSERLDTRDTYAFFENNDIDHVGIEDVGKVWPLLDLKVGSLVSGRHRHAALQAITDDLLLNVSPFVFALLAEFGRADIIGHARDISVRNRAALEQALAGGPLTVVVGGPTMSIAWVRIPDDWDCVEFCDWLEKRSITLLPGRPFYWADPEQGARHVRVALMRPAASFAASVAALADAVGDYEPR